MKKTVTIVMVCVAFLLSSCVKDLDFEQAENLDLTPVVVTSLINFDLSQKEDFVEGTIEKTSFKKRSEVTFFDNKTAKNNLNKIKLDVEVSNEVERKFTINIKFLDENETIVYELLTNEVIEASNSNFQKTEGFFKIGDKSQILNVKYIDVAVEMEPSLGGILDSSLDNRFTLKSSATLKMKF